MNYPVWELSFGLGILIAVVSIVHVFVSQFAVGGGLFLVLTEHKAYREKDQGLLEWLQKHTRFFVLLTVVFGAVSGVGIWFTIGLIHPQGTSALIHSFVWGWAIEWVFFFLEITAALLYLYGWKKLNPRVHLWLGWIYFIAAYASLLIINGILSFMLTPGKWIETHYFWHGFLNPTYFPSTVFRTFLSMTLAGGYALITATLIKQTELKKKAIRWAARWMVIGLVLMVPSAYWYIRAIPPIFIENGFTHMATSMFYSDLLMIFSIISLILALGAWIFSRKLPLAYAVITLISLFMVVWSFEFIREAIRKPYLISNYMYGNSLFVDSKQGQVELTSEFFQQNGVLKNARWVSVREISPQNRLQAGKELFRVQCRTCHTENGYRGVAKYISKRQWDRGTIFAMLESVDLMFNGVMPPFTGDSLEQAALADYLSSLHPISKKSFSDGGQVFQSYCGTCHQVNPEEGAFAVFAEDAEEDIVMKLESLKDWYIRMPDLKLTDEEKTLLARFIMQVNGKKTEEK